VVALAFAREGGDVVLTCLAAEEDDANTTVEHVRTESREAVVLAADLTEQAGCEWVVEETARRFGGIDILVSNAAYVSWSSVDTADPGDNASRKSRVVRRSGTYRTSGSTGRARTRFRVPRLSRVELCDRRGDRGDRRFTDRLIRPTKADVAAAGHTRRPSGYTRVPSPSRSLRRPPVDERRTGGAGWSIRCAPGMIIQVSGFDVADSNDSGIADAGKRLVTVTVEYRPGIAVVTVAGEIDMASAPALESAVRESLVGRPAKLVVDLTGARFFSSAGIAILVTAHRDGGAETAVRIVASSRVVLRPLELTGLTNDLAIYDTLQSALDE
jgi:anti-anti-sigma factor